MSTHAQLSAHDIRGPISQLLEVFTGPDAEVWLVAFKKFLRKEQPWSEKDDLRKVLHDRGWTDEQISDLFKGSALEILYKRMFPPASILDSQVEDVFTEEAIWRAGMRHGKFRAINVFRNDDIRTVRQVVQLTERQLLRMPNAGHKLVEVVKAVLAEHGLHLGMDLTRSY